MNAIILLAVLGIAGLYLGIYNFKKVLVPLMVTGLVATAILLGTNLLGNDVYLKGMLSFDTPARAYSILMIFLTACILVISPKFLDFGKNYLEDLYALLIFSLIGGIMMVSYTNMVTFFLGIETLSIPLYVLVGSRKNDLSSNEAAMKYFLMGSFATGFLLFGIALIYGATGSFNLADISAYSQSHSGELPAWFTTGVLLMLVGMAFKVSAFPFHFWAPDVYEGSPTIFTTFMATVVKVAGFGAMARFFSLIVPESVGLTNIIWLLAVATMFIGNMTATYQKGFKRMLAYSGIAHAGYMLMAVTVGGEFIYQYTFLYLAAYSVASLGLFILLLYRGEINGDSSFENLNGLIKKKPLLAIASTICLLSLAGIPVTAGFFAKFYLFYHVISKGFIVLAILAILNSAISIYYYFRPILAMYFGQEIEKEAPSIIPVSSWVILCISVLAILILGIHPSWILGIF